VSDSDTNSNTDKFVGHDPDEIAEQIQKYRRGLEAAPGNWPAKRELAAAVRELMDCLCATDAPSEELLSIADQVRASARRFSDQPRMSELPGVAEGSLAGGMEMFMDRSPLVGLANPIAPPLVLEPNHDTQIVHGHVYFGNAYEGAPGCVHGGYVSAVFDEALGMSCIFSGGPGMTGELKTRYRKPTPIKTPLQLEARPKRRASSSRSTTRSSANCARPSRAAKRADPALDPQREASWANTPATPDCETFFRHRKDSASARCTAEPKLWAVCWRAVGLDSWTTGAQRQCARTRSGQ